MFILKALTAHTVKDNPFTYTEENKLFMIAFDLIFKTF